MRSAATSRKVGLSAKGLRNMSEQANEFTFIVGSQPYPCPLHVAEFLSPRVGELRSVDDTVHELLIDVDDPSGHFHQFLLLGRGHDIWVNPENRSTILSICGELWNSELYERVFRRTDGEITVDNVVGRIVFLLKMRCSVAAELEFLASHFHALRDPSRDLRPLPFSVVSELVCSSSLRVASEDSLCEFIMSQTAGDADFATLLESVRFEYVSASKFAEFCEFISDSFGFLTRSLWDSLQLRFSLPVSPKVSNDRLFVEPKRGKEFVPSSTAPLNGIIAYLTDQCGGNVHSRNVVSITASSTGGTGWEPSNSADLFSDSFFHSRDSPNSWICYDFKNMTIRPTHYSLRSRCNAGRGNHQLKNWAIEGSADGTTWIKLDRRENVLDLDAQNVTHTFALARSEEIRMIRLRQTGVNSSGNNYLIFSSFEVFGRLLT
jgi:hypothetical protein